MPALTLNGYASLTGAQKAAVFLLAAGAESAAALFARMDDDEVAAISKAMSGLGTVGAEVVERASAEFANQVSFTGGVRGTHDSTERLLRKTLPKARVDQIMEEIRGPAGRTIWQKLSNANPETLANYLKKECPQTIAVVLSKLSRKAAAHVLDRLPRGLAEEIVARMLRMENVPEDVLTDLEATLRNEFVSTLAHASRGDRHARMADIVNTMDRRSAARFLDAMGRRAPEDAERIRKLMFTFDDLAGLAPGDVQAVIRRVDKERLAVAMKGAGEPVNNLFVSGMSQRAAKIFREDLAALGPLRAREVDAAQAEIVAEVEAMAARGEITLARGADDDQLIY